MGHGGRRRAWVGLIVGAVVLTLAGCATPEPQPDRVAGATTSRVGSSDSSDDDEDDDGLTRGTRSLTPWTPSPRPTWSAPASALWESGTHLVTSPKGTFSAVVPRTWRPAPCPVAGADCLHVVPAGAPDSAGLLVGARATAWRAARSTSTAGCPVRGC